MPSADILAVPSVVVQASARPMLTDRVEAALDGLIPVLQQAARRRVVPVRNIEVSGFTDPDEGTLELVVTQWVALTPPDAVGYWDYLGTVIEEWLRSAPKGLTAVARDRIAVEVRSQLNASSV